MYPGRRVLVLRWARNFSAIKAHCAVPGGAFKKKARARGTLTILSAAAEKELVTWVNDLRGEGVPVTSLMLRLKALDVSKRYNLLLFRASPSWQQRFKARHRLSMRSRTRRGQVSPPELENVAAEFAAKVKAKRLSSVSVIHNADQTATFFEYLPKKTLHITGDKTVWVRCGGKSKEHSVMLLGDSSGKKYPPFLVFKSKPSFIPAKREQNFLTRHGFGRTVWKEVAEAQLSEDIRVYGNLKGWWNSYLSVEFLQYHFGSRPNMAQPILLLWDDFSGHWSSEVIQCARQLNVVLIKVPPGATSVCQPADATWNGPLKARLRTQWIAHLQEQLLQREPGIPFKLQAPTRREICRWVSSAWKQLPATVITAGYRKCQIAAPDDPGLADVIERLDKLGLIDKTVGEITVERDFDQDHVVVEEVVV